MTFAIARGGTKCHSENITTNPKLHHKADRFLMKSPKFSCKTIGSHRSNSLHIPMSSQRLSYNRKARPFNHKA